MRKPIHDTSISFNRRRNEYGRGAAFRQNFFKRKKRFKVNCYHDVSDLYYAPVYWGYMVEMKILNPTPLFKLKCF